MSERLPLFPLGSVLFPGLVLPLHIFEERYRSLVRDLLEQPEDQRRFGVVAIGLGHEVGAGAAQRTAEVGCTAELQDADPYEDGRFDIVTTGTTRFRVDAIDDSGPYLQGDVTTLPDTPGEQAGAYVPGVTTLFHRYCELLRDQGASVHEPDGLPDDPSQLSYLVGAAVILDLHERQSLLEAPDSATRLRHELQLLWREISILRGFPSLPAYDLLSKEINAN